MLPFLLLASCSYKEETREIGHKGKARINPFLAAERFLAEYDFEIESKSGWPDLEDEVSLVIIPASAISARGYTDDLDQWANYQGGHVVVLLSYGESYLSDWGISDFSGLDEADDLADPFTEWMGELGVEFEFDAGEDNDPLTVEKLDFLGEEFEVFMEAKVCPLDVDDEAVMIRSVEHGEGRVTVIADARPFRNRWIGDYDHAALLLALEDAAPYEGTTAFVRNVSLSFFGLLWGRAWPAVIALILLVIFWLWKSLPRFGPLDSQESTAQARAYDHHLEALGDFHWRLDHAEGLLRPLRDALIERAQRLALTSGHREGDVFQLIAERSGISRERAERAMTFEKSKDAGTFTRLVADLQTIHLSIP
ncbi:DUF4350 domain-containing protein [Haloferula sp.]|uniref:DUF4350 domain-containing protein n=1 Tax=Haloferula sp. TaxID=2497595 RepID=UPI00329E76CC